MKRFAQSAAGALVLAAVAAAAAGAQEKSSFFKPPVFVFQPGIVTANAVSPTVENADVLSGLNVRFMTILPTAARYLVGVAGVQFQPNGVGGNKNNSPGFFYGGVVPIPIISTATQGWLSFSLDPLGVYAPSGYSSDHPYSHEAFLEGAFVLNVGQKMMKDVPMFAGMSAYFLVDQQLTHPAKDSKGDNDRWNPVLLYGVTVPIAAPK